METGSTLINRGAPCHLSGLDAYSGLPRMDLGKNGRQRTKKYHSMLSIGVKGSINAEDNVEKNQFL
jgi:hypothetical protein